MEGENQKHNKITLSTYIAILAILVIIVLAGFIYMQKINSDREISGLKNDAEELKATVTELEGKIDTSAEVPDTVESNQETSSTNESQFSTYQENFEKTYKSVIGKSDYADQEIIFSSEDDTYFFPGISLITVDKNGDAYVHIKNTSSRYSKYGEMIKVDTNVAKIQRCTVGQDNYADILLIHKDGTVSKIEGLDKENEKIQTKKIEKAQNIVDIISISEGDYEGSGARTYYLVDINGNIIDINK